MSRKRAHSQVLAEYIIENHETDVTLDDVETWADDPLYEWVEDFGHSWEGERGWVDLEDL